MENGKYADKQKSFGIGTADEALLKYSVPTTLTLMVNYIYNIADQIFCGAGGRYYRKWRLSTLLFRCRFLSMPLRCCWGMAVLPMSVCVWGRRTGKCQSRFQSDSDVDSYRRSDDGSACGILAPYIVTLFGTTDTAYGESLAYMRVIAIGIPFQLICPAFTAMIRADGSPQYTMKCNDGRRGGQYYSGSCLYFRLKDGCCRGRYCHGDWRNGSRYIMSALFAQITVCTA